MNPLNLPKYNFRFKKNDKGLPLIFDIVRKKWLVITPEEWVRQHWVHHLVAQYKIGLGSIQIEGGLKVAQRNKKSDILVTKNGKPFILIECKRPNIEIGPNTLKQSLQYNSVHQADYVILTNGIAHYYFHFNKESGNFNQISTPEHF